MPACPYCSSSDLTRDGHNQRGRAVRASRTCGRHATSESTSLVAGHRFPRDIILLALRYYLQLGAAAERIAGILADRGVDVSRRTILHWVQKFGRLCPRRSVGTGSQSARPGWWMRRT
jgi:transposase-like protein